MFGSLFGGQYRCLHCGSYSTLSTNGANLPWSWRMLEYGRIGPFCCVPHAMEFTVGTFDGGGEPKFTLKEWERLRFVRETFTKDLVEA